MWNSHYFGFIFEFMGLISPEYYVDFGLAWLWKYGVYIVDPYCGSCITLCFIPHCFFCSWNWLWTKGIRQKMYLWVSWFWYYLSSEVHTSWCYPPVQGNYTSRNGVLLSHLGRSFYLSLYNCCTLWLGSMAFCTPEGGNGTRGEAEGAIFPRGCTKPMDPSHSAQQLFCYTLVTLIFLFVKFFCYLQTLLRRSIHCLISRRTRNNSLLFPRTCGCFVHSAGNRPTLGTIKVMYTVVHHFLCYPPRCALRLARILSLGTCVFVARHVIGSRPIKLHILLPRYNNNDC